MEVDDHLYVRFDWSINAIGMVDFLFNELRDYIHLFIHFSISE